MWSKHKVTKAVKDKTQDNFNGLKHSDQTEDSFDLQNKQTNYEGDILNLRQ